METKTLQADLTLLSLPSGGKEPLFCRLYSPAGIGPFPTIVLFHGFPGKQLNIDWAVDLQKQGYNVLVTTYRGSWGSPGAFTFAHALEDAEAIMAEVMSEAFASTHHVDREAVTIVGHSMGGFVGLHAFAALPMIKSCVAISPFNFGLVGSLIHDYPEHEPTLLGVLERGAVFLNGSDAHALLFELKEHHETWNLLTLKEALAARDVLLVTSETDETSVKSLHHDLLVDASNFEELVVETDHNYIQNRDATFASWTNWLNAKKGSSSR